MRKIHSGFTLIELIIVIVLLGILSIVAAPRFIDIGSDARIAKLESLEGSIRSAANLINVKAIIENKTDCSTNPTVAIGADNITLRCGFPCPHPNGIAKAIDSDAELTWVGGNCSGTLGNIRVRLNNAPDPENRSLRYAASRDERGPRITSTTTGC